MLINNAVSAGIGFVPIVGDIALATYKANSRNAALLEEYLRIRGAEALKARIIGVSSTKQVLTECRSGGRRENPRSGCPAWGWIGQRRAHRCRRFGPWWKEKVTFLRLLNEEKAKRCCYSGIIYTCSDWTADYLSTSV